MLPNGLSIKLRIKKKDTMTTHRVQEHELLQRLERLCEERFVWSKQVALAGPVIEPFESFAKSEAFHIFSSTYA